MRPGLTVMRMLYCSCSPAILGTGAQQMPNGKIILGQDFGLSAALKEITI